MATIADLVVRYRADTRGYTRGAAMVDRTVERQRRSFHSAANLIRGLYAGAAVIAVRRTFELGAAVEETGSKYRTVFGPAVAETNVLLGRQARLMGLTDQEAQSLLATTGAMAQGFGFSQAASAGFAAEVQTLAADLASFNNLRLEDTSRSVQSALAGERESLKRLGIVILETDVQQRALANTGKSVAASLTQQEKATATLQLITERAGVAVGDLDRTQDAAANSARAIMARFRQFRDDIATGLLPTFALLIGMTDDHTHGLADWGEQFARSGQVIAAWTRAILTSFGALGTSIKQLFNIAGNGLAILMFTLRHGFTQAFSPEVFREAIQPLLDNMQISANEIADAWINVGTAVALARDAMAGLRVLDTDRQVRLPAVIEDMTRGLNEFQRTAQGVANAFTSAFGNAITGVGDAFKSFVQLMIGMLLELLAKLALFKFLQFAFPGSMAPGGLLEGLFNFGGGLASGGPVQPGTAYMVGEQGPELFVPQQSGTVVPNGGSFVLDLSSLPRAMSPGEAARQRESIEYIAAALKQHVAMGGAFA